MASDVADLRRLLDAATRRPWTDDGYRVRGASEDDDPRNGPMVFEYKHFGENGEADAALTVATVNRLSGLLDRMERMERMEARVAELEAIIAGRTTPPTDAEIEAHAATGGSWLTGDTVTWAPESLRAMRDGGEVAANGCAWIALDADNRPCVWPEVSRG